jgi:cytochrome P450
MFAIWMSIFGNGMLGSEGNDWKDKRKLLSKVFSYDFIIDNLPMIISIADQVFDDF